MSEAIKSALSAEEWAADSIQRTDKRGNVLVIVRDRSESTEQAGGHDHALAAIALNGKPFGFTRADGAFLRSWANQAPERSFVQSELRSIADRIEALLPPE